METSPGSSESSESKALLESRTDAAAAAHIPARPQVPLALAAALVLQLVTSAIISLRMELLFNGADFSKGFQEVLLRWDRLGSALPVAWLALAIAGAFELSRRTSEQARRGARLILGALIAIFAARLAFHYLVYGLRHGEDVTKLQYLDDLRTWLRQLRATCWLLASAGMLLCGWRVRGVRLLAAPLIITTLLATPYDFYARHLYGLLPRSWIAAYIQTTLLDGLYLLLALLVLRRGAPLADPGGGWERAAAALDRAGSALYARLWISASSITLMLLALGSDPSEGLAKLWRLGVPFGVAVASLVLVSSVMSIAGLTAPRAPRATLYAAAVLLMTATFLSMAQIFIQLHNWPEVTDEARALPYLMPVIAALALVCLSWGLTNLSHLLPSRAVQAQAASSMTTVFLCQLTALGAQYYVSTVSDLTPVTSTLWILFVIAASVVALVSQARLCRALAEQLRERTELPPATLLPK